MGSKEPRRNFESVVAAMIEEGFESKILKNIIDIGQGGDKLAQQL